MTFLPGTPVTDDKLNYFIFQNTHSSSLFRRYFKANAFFPTPPQFILLTYLIKIPLPLLLLFLLFTGAIKIPLLTDSDLTSNSLTSVPKQAQEGQKRGLIYPLWSATNLYLKRGREQKKTVVKDGTLTPNFNQYLACKIKDCTFRSPVITRDPYSPFKMHTVQIYTAAELNYQHLKGNALSVSYMLLDRAY